MYVWGPWVCSAAAPGCEGPASRNARATCCPALPRSQLAERVRHEETAGGVRTPVHPPSTRSWPAWVDCSTLGRLGAGKAVCSKTMREMHTWRSISWAEGVGAAREGALMAATHVAALHTSTSTFLKRQQLLEAAAHPMNGHQCSCTANSLLCGRMHACAFASCRLSGQRWVSAAGVKVSRKCCCGGNLLPSSR